MADTANLQQGDKLVQKTTDPVKKVYEVTNVDVANNVVHLKDTSTTEESSVDLNKVTDSYNKVEAQSKLDLYSYDDDFRLLYELKRQYKLAGEGTIDEEEIKAMEEELRKIVQQDVLTPEAIEDIKLQIKDIIPKSDALYTFFFEKSEKYLVKPIKHAAGFLEEALSDLKDNAGKLLKNLEDQVLNLKHALSVVKAFDPLNPTKNDITLFFNAVGWARANFHIPEIKQYEFVLTSTSLEPKDKIEEIKGLQDYREYFRSTVEQRNKDLKLKYEEAMKQLEIALTDAQDRLLDAKRRKDLLLIDKYHNELEKLKKKYLNLKFHGPEKVYYTLSNIADDSIESIIDKVPLEKIQTDAIQGIGAVLSKKELSIKKLNDIVFHTLVDKFYEAIGQLKENAERINYHIENGKELSLKDFHGLLAVIPLTNRIKQLKYEYKKLLEDNPRLVNTPSTKQLVQKINTLINFSDTFLSGSKKKKSPGDELYDRIYSVLQDSRILLEELYTEVTKSTVDLRLTGAGMQAMYKIEDKIKFSLKIIKDTIKSFNIIMNKGKFAAISESKLYKLGFDALNVLFSKNPNTYVLDVLYGDESVVDYFTKTEDFFVSKKIATDDADIIYLKYANKVDKIGNDSIYIVLIV